MKYFLITIFCIMIFVFNGCMVSESVKTDSIGENSKTTHKYYFIGIPVYEEEKDETDEIPD